jgi:hypothetical protein
LSDELIAEALLGEEAEKFLESAVGRYLIGAAQQEVAAAQEDLENADPSNEKAIRDIQCRAKVGRMIEKWLLELVDKGRAAVEIYQHERDT